MSEHIVGSPWDSEEVIAERRRRQEEYERKTFWQKLDWEGRLVLCGYVVMAFVLLDGLAGSDQAVQGQVVSQGYTAPYVRRESYMVGKTTQYHDVTYGPYWDVTVRSVVSGECSYRVTQQCFNACHQGGPVTVGWRKGLITGILYKTWIQEPRTAEKAL